jgi:protein disulfide-isomerase A1
VLIKLPLILTNIQDEIGPSNYRLYVEAELPLAYLFVDSSVSGQFDDYIARVTPIAKEVKGKLNWVWIDWYYIIFCTIE